MTWPWEVTTQYLRSKGVDLDYIQSLKTDYVLSDENFWEYHKYIKTERNILVPLKKVKGLSNRGEPNRSWWDHLQGCGHVVTDRLESLQKIMEKKGVEAFRKSFEEEEYKVYFAYYIDLDEYFLSVDGTHRVIWAKTLNVPYICADVDKYRLHHADLKEVLRPNIKQLSIYHHLREIWKLIKG